MAEPRRRGDASPSREAIATAALSYLDNAPLETLSVRGLADELGSFHANLYRRIASKDDLLDLVAGTIYAKAGPPPQEGDDDRAELLAYATRLRTAWLAHPKAYPLLSRHGDHAVMAALDGIAGALFRLGLDVDAVRLGLRDYLGYVFGNILMEAVALAEPASYSALDVREEHHYLQQLVTSPDQVAGGGGDLPADEVAFQVGLQRLIDNWTAD